MKDCSLPGVSTKCLYPQSGCVIIPFVSVHSCFLGRLRQRHSGLYVAVCLCVISLWSPVVSLASLRRMRSAQCHGWISSPLATKKRVAVPRRPQLGDTPHNYVVKRQNEQGNIFSSIIYERAGGGGSKRVSWPGETVLNSPLVQQHCKI